MSAHRPSLDLGTDVVTLTAAVCDIESVSGNEGPLADAVEQALRALPHLAVTRDGDAVVARTDLGRAERVVIAGHLDTVPVAANLPTRRVDGPGGERMYGRGTCDMKGGVAVALRLAATIAEPARDVTYVFYDNEEVAAVKNGLGRLARNSPELLRGDFAILMEPTDAGVEGGCQGSLRAVVGVGGEAAHSARWWMGTNAIHAAGGVLDRLRDYVPREVEVEGLIYREGLQAVAVAGGIAGNVVPDHCEVTVNHRFAPDRSSEEAEAHVRAVFPGYDVEVVDVSPAARPGLDRPAVAAFVAAIGATARPKYGWTDVARFSSLGIPAVNYGPGSPSLAHRDDEHVVVDQLRICESRLASWLAP